MPPLYRTKGRVDSHFLGGINVMQLMHLILYKPRSPPFGLICLYVNNFIVFDWHLLIFPPIHLLGIVATKSALVIVPLALVEDRVMSACDI